MGFTPERTTQEMRPKRNTSNRGGFSYKPGLRPIAQPIFKNFTDLSRKIASIRRNSSAEKLALSKHATSFICCGRQPDKRCSHGLMPQHPAQCHLRQALIALCSQRIELPDGRQLLVGNLFALRNRVVCRPGPSGIPSIYLLVNMPCASGQNAIQPTPSPPTPRATHSLQSDDLMPRGLVD